MIDSKQAEFLWRVVSTGFFKNRANNISRLPSVDSALALDWQPEVEAELLQYLTDGDQASFQSLALTAARKYYFPPNMHAILVAALFETRLIDIREALAMLSSLKEGEESSSTSVRRLLDVVWQINEDEKDGIMSVEQDRLLPETLHKIFVDANEGTES